MVGGPAILVRKKTMPAAADWWQRSVKATQLNFGDEQISSNTQTPLQQWHLVAAAAGEDSRQQQRKHQTKGDLLVQEVLTRVGRRIQDQLGVLRRNGNNKMTSGNLHPRTTKGASDRKIEQVITLSKTVKKVSSTMIVKCNQRWGQRS